MARTKPLGARRQARRARRCLRAGHRFGLDQTVGAGIRRQVCRVCWAVTIDLRDADSGAVIISQDRLRSSMLADGSDAETSG